jgi:hypothetical protein
MSAKPWRLRRHDTHEASGYAILPGGDELKWRRGGAAPSPAPKNTEKGVSRPRFELRTFCVLDRCDNQLRHRPALKVGEI